MAWVPGDPPRRVCIKLELKKKEKTMVLDVERTLRIKKPLMAKVFSTVLNQ